MIRMPGEGIRIVAQGVQRGRIESFSYEGLSYCGRIQPVEEPADYDIIDAEAHMRLMIGEFELFNKNGKKIPSDVVTAVRNMRTPGLAADTIAAAVIDTMEKRQELLEALDPIERMEMLYSFLNTENQIYGLEERVRGRVKVQMDKAQRDYYLHDKIKASTASWEITMNPAAAELLRRLKPAKCPPKQKRRPKKSFPEWKRCPRECPKARFCVPISSACWSCPGKHRRKITWIFRTPEKYWMTIITAWKKSKKGSSNI